MLHESIHPIWNQLIENIKESNSCKGIDVGKILDIDLIHNFLTE